MRFDVVLNLPLRNYYYGKSVYNKMNSEKLEIMWCLQKIRLSHSASSKKVCLGKL